jgi:hypothetical protein
VLLSRFWYVALGVALAAAVFLLYLATAVANRGASTTGDQLLTAASRSVYWYMTDDSRTRAAALIPLALDGDVRDGLDKSSKADAAKEVESALRDKAKSALNAFRNESQQEGMIFDALWAIDIHGRVLANSNFERGTNSEHYEMGGFSLVADCNHGWIRDDAWVFNGQIYRVVGQPVETNVGGAPVGCIVGAKVVDDTYAQSISDKTGAAVAFYAGETRVAKGVQQGFDSAWLSVINTDLAEVEQDADYIEKGRTTPRTLRKNAGFDIRGVFARMPGEAWDLGAGYVVGHRQTVVTQPYEFQDLADQSDKDAVPLLSLALIALGLAALGVLFSVLEHTIPLARFRRSVSELANRKNDVDVLKPSTFRGVYKKIASDVNDSLDKIAAKAGIDRGPADLESVLGPLPAAPQMSAFAVPKSAARPSAGGADTPSSSKRIPVPQPSSASTPESGGKALPQAKRSLPKAGPIGRDASPAPTAAAAAASSDDDEQTVENRAGLPNAADFGRALSGRSGSDQGEEDDAPTRVAPKPEIDAALLAKLKAEDAAAGVPDEETEWRQVYADFVAMKKQFGEPTEKLTYEKFRGTLQRNKDALLARHDCVRVKFRVYEKQGRAALKASPVK